MLRDLLIERGVGEKGGFRWRSHEVSRIEGLSDAVFGFAITPGAGARIGLRSQGIRGQGVSGFRH